jgi:hypothetical protein
MFSAELLSPGWTPTISQEELDEANQRLEDQHILYRWRWLDLNQKVINLCGAITLHAEALNAAA